MKLSEYKGEAALDMLAELIEPVAEIMSDKEVFSILKGEKNRIKAIKPAIKNHKKAVIQIIAILEGEEPEQYAEKVNLLTLPVKLMQLLNDPDLMQLFT